MHNNKDFSNDRYALAGYWSPSTSAANFCEEDYAITIYIAEFINTLSNLAYIFLALRYSRVRRNNGAGWRFDSMSLSLILVGITSFVFHATLRQSMQYMDDLSMFAIATSIVHRLYTVGKPTGTRKAITVVLVSTVTALSAYYVNSGKLFVHISIFAGLLTLIWPRTLYLLYTRSYTEQRRSVMLRQFMIAVGTLISAFAIWNVDLEKCFELRGYRQDIGLPWAWLLELHGWWHVLTAIGAIQYMYLTRELCEF